MNNYFGLKHYSNDKILYVQWFEDNIIPSHPMEFDVIESCYDASDWVILPVEVIVK